MSAEEDYTIGELAQEAEVTTRTIRYYVEQGLLPPPHSAGRAATYGTEHLHRLELIRLLKQEFLPLAEIKALLDGLGDDGVQGLLEERRQSMPSPAPESAKEYLRSLLDPPSPSTPLRRRMATFKTDDFAAPATVKSQRLFLKRPPVAEDPSRVVEEATTGQGARTVWLRFSVHRDVELHVRQPPGDPELGSRLDQLIADIRRVIVKYSS